MAAKIAGRRRWLKLNDIVWVNYLTTLSHACSYERYDATIRNVLELDLEKRSYNERTGSAILWLQNGQEYSTADCMRPLLLFLVKITPYEPCLSMWWGVVMATLKEK